MPLEPHTKLWSRLIDNTLNQYVSMKNQPVPVTHALLEALSHIEPDIFDLLGKGIKFFVVLMAKNEFSTPYLVPPQVSAKSCQLRNRDGPP